MDSVERLIATVLSAVDDCRSTRQTLADWRSRQERNATERRRRAAEEAWLRQEVLLRARSLATELRVFREHVASRRSLSA